MLLGMACRFEASQELEVLPIGGDFTLKSTQNKSFRLFEHGDEVKLLYFGYTHCPDACPTALSKVRKVEELLGLQRESLLTLFVTVDPERDSPERLREWLDFFGVRGVGLWGTDQELQEVASRFGAFYERSTQQTAVGYLVDHTTFLFLIDRQGRVRKVIGSEVEPHKIAAWVERLLREPKTKP